MSMSRIPPVEGMELQGHEGSGVTEMGMLFRVMGQRPELAQESMRLLETAMRSGTVDALYHIDQHAHLFTERERVALRFAEIMTTGARDVDEALWDELQVHFDDGEIVEIATVIGLFNFFNRFADALQILPSSDTHTNVK